MKQRSVKCILLTLPLLFLIMGGCSLGNKDTSTNTGAVSQDQKSTGADTKVSPQETKDQLAGQETTTLRLNFKDGYVTFTGYPYVDKNYRPRLYNLIYVNTIFAENDMDNLTDPSGKWKDIYETSSAENKIYMPIGRTAGDSPIWQTMDIVKKADVAGILGSCTEIDYTLTGDLKGVVYNCPATDANKTSVGSKPCFIPIDSATGILYRQYSTDGSATGDMCEVVKNNYISSIVFQKW